MTATYKNDDLQFLYPENWRVQESFQTEQIYDVLLESPDGCIWSVSVFLNGSSREDLLNECATALNDQYEDFEKFEWAGEIDGQAAIGFESNFFCLDFIVTAQARAFSIGTKTFNVFCQAEMRDFDKHQEVFDAITISLIRSMRDVE